MVETEQSPRRLDTRELQGVPIRPVFYNDLDVVQAITKCIWQRIQGAFDKDFKQVVIHALIIAPRGPPSDTRWRERHGLGTRGLSVGQMMLRPEQRVAIGKWLMS